MSFRNITAFFNWLETALYHWRFALLWVGLLAIIVVSFSQNWGYHVDNDTPSFAVADLLMNYAGGFARRGLIGHIALTLSDAFGGLPWIWAWAIGCGITALLFTLCIRIFRRLPTDTKFLPLILAPWGLFFYVYDEGAALRKEMLGFLALVMILQALAARTERRALAWVLAGMIVFVVSLFAHEAMMMMAPAQVLAVILIALHWTRLSRLLYALTGVVAAGSVGICIFLIKLPIPDIATMCAAAQTACSGPADWLTKSLSHNIYYTLDKRNFAHVVTHGMMFVLCVFPMLGFRARGLTRAQLGLIFGVCVIFALPIFAVATDWGRWIHMIVLPIALIALAAIPDGYVQYRRMLPHWLAVLYVSSLSLMHHYWGVELRAVLILPVLALLIGFDQLRKPHA